MVNKLQLYLSNITCSTKFTISCTDEIIVGDFKKLVAKELNSFPCLFTLVYKGKRLDENEELPLNNVENENTVNFMMRLKPEVELLLEIKRKMNFQTYRGWDRETDLKEWCYLRLNNDDINGKYKVCEIISYIRNSNLPEEIGGLKVLERLCVPASNISGKIPRTFCNLSNLQVLNLSKNKLEGTIPNGIGNLTNLVSLSFFNNNLEGDIPESIYNLSKLNRLILGKNNFTGTISPNVGNLVDLQILSFTQNKMEGEVPDQINNLKKLKWFFLLGNNFIYPDKNTISFKII